MAKSTNGIGQASFRTSSPVSSSNSDEGDFLGDEEQEVKPDPLELSTTRRRFEDISGDYYDESGGEYQPQKKHRGGRVRDPIWQHFHLIESPRGDNQAIWQCNDCNYSLARPQADRMKKHKIKCVPIVRGDQANDEDNDTSLNAIIPEAEDATTRTKTQKNKAENPSSTSLANIIPSKLGITPSTANSITKQLRRIADALEESNKLKKLQLGLDPYAPFDGESPRKS